MRAVSSVRARLRRAAATQVSNLIGSKAISALTLSPENNKVKPAISINERIRLASKYTPLHATLRLRRWYLSTRQFTVMSESKFQFCIAIKANSVELERRITPVIARRSPNVFVRYRMTERSQRNNRRSSKHSRPSRRSDVPSGTASFSERFYYISRRRATRARVSFVYQRVIKIFQLLKC